LLLTYSSFKKFIADQIDFFLETNSTSDVSNTTIWESLKAYLRGQIISYAAHKKKERSKRSTELIQQIADIDKRPDVGDHGNCIKSTSFPYLSLKLCLAYWPKLSQFGPDH
uniref:Histone H2A/H2B/H3 domain-containing protein n=1 Tax=Pygocentrus nattereri TaxID=42514 RepID=A0AAR2LRF2_PYGNA